MPSNISDSKETDLRDWLQENASQFLDPLEKIESVVYLKNTIKNDTNASGLGITFDHRYDIQPRAIFTTVNKSGAVNLGIIETSTRAIGLKDIGILHTYAKMIEPKYALLLCENSYSKELTYLLTDPKIEPRLMGYADGRQLKLLDIN